MKRIIIPKKPYKTRGYYVSKHAVYDMNLRRITKGQLGIHLSKKPLFKSKISVDKFGRRYYKRFSLNKIFTIINPIRKIVASVRKYRDKELRKEKCKR